MGLRSSKYPSHDRPNPQSTPNVFSDDILMIILSFESWEGVEYPDAIVRTYSKVCVQWRRIIQNECQWTFQIDSHIKRKRWKLILRHWRVKSMKIIDLREGTLLRILQDHSDRALHLEELCIRQCSKRYTDSFMPTIIASSLNLRVLKFVEINVSDQDLLILAQSENMRNLRTLHVKCTHKRLFGDEGVIGLCSSAFLKCLRELHLGYSNISVRSVEKIVNVFQLNQLVFDSTSLTDESLVAIANSSNMINLEILDFYWNLITKEGVKALARSIFVRKLTFLNVSYGGFGNEGFIELVSSENLSNIKYLGAIGCGIQSSGMHSLVSSHHLTNLSSLVLSNNLIGNTGFYALVSSPNMINLVTLELNGIGLENSDRAVFDLVTNCNNFPKLKSLSLHSNNIGIQSKSHLLNFKRFQSLKWFCFGESDGLASEINRFYQDYSRRIYVY